MVFLLVALLLLQVPKTRPLIIFLFNAVSNFELSCFQTGLLLLTHRSLSHSNNHANCWSFESNAAYAHMYIHITSTFTYVIYFKVQHSNCSHLEWPAVRKQSTYIPYIKKKQHSVICIHKIPILILLLSPLLFYVFGYLATNTFK